MIAVIDQIVLDCEDPERSARFWSELTGATATVRSEAWAFIESRPRLCFQRVPEPRSVKNRMHLDWTGDADALADRVIVLGGRILDRFRDPQGYVIVAADPDGNEFCLTEPAQV